MDYKTLLVLISGVSFFLIPFIVFSFRRWKSLRQESRDNCHSVLSEIYTRDARETGAMLGTLNKSVDHEEEEFYRDVGQC